MKSQDIAMIVLIAGVSIIASYFGFQAIPGIGNPAEETYTTKTMTAISAEMADPSDEIFNSDAINPTVRTVISEDGGNKILSESK